MSRLEGKKPWDTVEPCRPLDLGLHRSHRRRTVRAEEMNIAPIAPKAIPDGEGAIETLTISKEKYDRPHYPDREQC